MNLRLHAREAPRPRTASPQALRCASCGALVARVRDTRFGLAPSVTFCRECSGAAATLDFPSF